MDYLDAGLCALGIDRGKTTLERYLAEIMLFNPTHGLVSGNDRQDIIIRHILDSLAPWQHIADEAARLAARLAESTTPVTIADVGTGAGFPGIPLAIVMDDCRFLLIEKMGRRVTFLHNAQAVLRLANTAIIESEVEKAGNARADMVTCRGFSEINDRLIGTFAALLNPGGTMLFYKGKREKIDREIEACAHAHQTTIIPYTPPFLNEERHLVMIKP
jgi:16S rRNA (guanine527-N7)-methyltransferase